MTNSRRTCKALLIPLLYLAAVIGVNAFDDGAASATESHVTAVCTSAGVSVSVFATDHGLTATVTDAYVLTGGTGGPFNPGLSATLRSLFVGAVLTTGPAPGDAGTSIVHVLPTPAGTWLVAITLTFSNGTTSTGPAVASTPCTDPTTTIAPTTTTPTPSTTVAPTTAPATTVATTTATTDGSATSLATGTTIGGAVVTLPRTGAGPGMASAAFAGLLLFLTGIVLIVLIVYVRRPEPIVG